MTGQKVPRGGDWSFSSSETRPRATSDDSTSVGLKCWRAKVDLPDPDGPAIISRSPGRSVMAGSPEISDPSGRPLARPPKARSRSPLPPTNITPLVSARLSSTAIMASSNPARRSTIAFHSAIFE